MRILCVSDQIDPLVYSTSVKERYSDVDAVFCAGDLSMDYVDFIVDALGRPTFFVYGNHDLTDYDHYERGGGDVGADARAVYDTSFRGHGADYVSGRCVRIRQQDKSNVLLIAGVSGSMRYNNGRDQFTEAQMKRKLLKLVPSLLWNRARYGRYCDVFLTHAAPRGIHDKEDKCHRGFKCFNWFMDRFSPALWIHGHIHLYDMNESRCTTYKKTTVVNAFSRVVLDLNLEFDKDKGEYIGSHVDILANR